MYREFFMLFPAYFKTINRKVFVYEIAIPLFFSAFTVFKIAKLEKETISALLTIMAIILGFVIATITILITSNNENLKKASKFPIGKRIWGKELTLLKALIIIFFYMAFISLLELIIGAITIVFSLSNNKIFIFLNVFLTFHLILLGIRNITNLFWIEFK